jgi:hypothetical protein
MARRRRSPRLTVRSSLVTTASPSSPSPSPPHPLPAPAKLQTTRLMIAGVGEDGDPRRSTTPASASAAWAPPAADRQGRRRLLLLHGRPSRGMGGEPARADGARRADGRRGLGQARAALGEGKLRRRELAAGGARRSSGCKARQPAAGGEQGPRDGAGWRACRTLKTARRRPRRTSGATVGHGRRPMHW